MYPLNFFYIFRCIDDHWYHFMFLLWIHNLEKHKEKKETAKERIDKTRANIKTVYRHSQVSDNVCTTTYYRGRIAS